MSHRSPDPARQSSSRSADLVAAAADVVVQVVLADPASAAVLSDLDGTLATIVNDPAAARPLPGVGSVLGRLARAVGVVGVISGRPAAFLAEHLAGAGDQVQLVGSYGLERVAGGVVRLDPAFEHWAQTVAEVTARARSEAPADVLVEAKPATVVLHWRTAPDREAWCQAAAERWAGETGLELAPARMAIELRPPIPADKGTAARSLAAGCRTVVFAGDDSGDLAAFDALDALAAAGVSSVKVVVGAAETPPALLAGADLVVPEPALWLQILEQLAEALEQAGTATIS